MIAGSLFWLSVFFILYTYLLYPLALGLLARLFPKPEPWAPYEPPVTLLIAAYNEKDVIAAKLENSLALDYPREKLQILVAADGSDDGTDAVVRSFAARGVELSYRPERGGKMAAINRALEAVRGEVIVMSDANNMYSTNALRDLVAPFQDPTVGATGGAKKILKGDGALGDSEGLYWKYESWIKVQETRLGCSTGAAGEANAIRRSLFELPPAGIINDDFYLMMSVIRRGTRAVYVPSAVSAERVSVSAADEIERRTRIVAGRYQAMLRAGEILPLRNPLVVWQVVSHKFLRPLVPFFMISALLAALGAVVFPSSGALPLLRLAGAYGWVAVGAQVAFYAAAWLGNLIGNRGPIGRLLYLATFLVNSNFAALQGLVRFAAGKQKSQWKRVQRREVGHG
jgi:cellulose synthase/poly-beta-1,6-N-acetylglucosamine synthase-like glycosyltransferase